MKSLMRPAERAQLAMVLEVSAFPKPGNIDRCHDYPDTRLEHFLASAIFVRPVLEEAEHTRGGTGRLIRQAVERSSGHSGGNTHFGAFILLIPLIQGGDIPGASRAVEQTDTNDAVEFYRAFGLTRVRILARDELDVNDPGVLDQLKQRAMTLLDVMRHSAGNDMVAREWVNGFARTRRGADLLKLYGCGRSSIVKTFLALLAEEPDTLVIKKHGIDVAQKTMEQARDVLAGTKNLEDFDRSCIAGSINPGSTADLIIASIYIALGEGWKWDC